MNTETLKGKWNEIKGEIRTTWGQLTSDEIEQTKGDFKSIQGLIQQKYGDTVENISQSLAKIVDRFAEPTKEGLRGNDQAKGSDSQA